MITSIYLVLMWIICSLGACFLHWFSESGGNQPMDFKKRVQRHRRTRIWYLPLRCGSA